METERLLGEYGARLASIERSVEDIGLDVKLLLAEKNQAEGAKKTVYTIAAVLGSVGGAAAAFASKLIK